MSNEQKHQRNGTAKLEAWRERRRAAKEAAMPHVQAHWKAVYGRDFIPRYVGGDLHRLEALIASHCNIPVHEVSNLDQLEFWRYAEVAVGAWQPAAPGEPANEDNANAIEQYVTMDQAAALVSKAKRTLRHYYDDAKMPEPDVRGKGGKPHEWKWDTLRPWLEETFERKLPERPPMLRLR